MSKRLIIFFAGLLLCLNFLCWEQVFILAEKHYLEVSFLDVGQGDSAFIQTPEEHQILIDGGPDSSLLQKLSLLMPVWDKTIDLVILTHPEKDHMQGLLEVLQRYKADYILWSGVRRDTAEGEEWERILDKQMKLGAKILIAEPSLMIGAGGVSIDTLFPLENMEGKELKNTSNDTCVVSKIIYGNNSFIFTGDISTAIEKKIINSKENLSADVLKIAHHGSKYSTSDLFLAAVAPRMAVIEVGKNSYGHPTEQVLQKLINFGIKVLRTDMNGDIKFISDGNNIIISKN